MLIPNDFRRRTERNGLQMREGLWRVGVGTQGILVGVCRWESRPLSSIPCLKITSLFQTYCKQETPNLHTIDQCPINDTLYKPISSDFYPLFRPNCFKKPCT